MDVLAAHKVYLDMHKLQLILFIFLIFH